MIDNAAGIRGDIQPSVHGLPESKRLEHSAAFLPQSRHGRIGDDDPQALILRQRFEHRRRLDHRLRHHQHQRLHRIRPTRPWPNILFGLQAGEQFVTDRRNEMNQPPPAVDVDLQTVFHAGNRPAQIQRRLDMQPHLDTGILCFEGSPEGFERRLEAR